MPRAVRTGLAACVAIVLALASRAWGGEPSVSLASLLEEMVDRDAAARFPNPAYTCRQQSSFDPKTKSPADREGWFANADWSHFRRSEMHEGREESVMLDAVGPGAVVRIWTTAFNPRGTIRVYLDDNAKPAIEERVDRLIGGEGLVGRPFSAVQARGMNFYLPIPYARRCVITYDRPWFWKDKAHEKPENQLYYQVNYRTYGPGARVESFSRAAFDRCKEQIARVGKSLLDPAKALPVGVRVSELRQRVLRNGDPWSLSAAPGGGQPSGRPGAIRRISLRLEAKDLAAATRSVVLSLNFDGKRTAWCPVGDFFGSGVGVNPFQTWWRKVDRDGWMHCYWVMPYQRSCEVTLNSLGDQEVKASAILAEGPWTWDDRSMHFHATWRQQFPIDTSEKSDWNYLAATGKGVYMGDTLALVNPVETWWGEGDEKVYVDGESFPSHVGTGTEDYYGYAWCTPEFFCDPFHAQPRAEGPANKGHVTNTRERILDGIPFTRSLRFDMEVWHWEAVQVAYAATTYWYGLPGAEANHAPMPEMAKIFTPPAPKRHKVEGAIEGEELKILQKTGGSDEVQQGRQFRWSNEAQLWWRDGKPGDRLVLALAVAQKGKYRLEASLTKAIDYGVVRLALDGKPLAEKIDLFHDGVVNGVVPLGIVELDAGEHRLQIEIVGANPRAVPRHMFGLDYLKLEPAK